MEVYTAVTHTSTSGVSMTYDRIQEKVKESMRNVKECQKSGSICEQIINLSQIFSVSSDHKSTLKDLFRRKNSLYFLKLQWMEKKWPEEAFLKRIVIFFRIVPLTT